MEDKKNETPREDAPVTPAQDAENARLSDAEVKALARELAAAIAPEAEKPDPAEQARREAEAARAAKAKRAKRRRRNLRGFLVRLVLLAVVIYVLFFRIIGVTTMPNGDMYPRIDAGDLVLFYRLDKEVRAQDIVVFEKDAADFSDYTAPDEAEPDAEPDAEPTVEPAVTPAPSRPEGPTTQQIEADTSFKARAYRFIYDLSVKLGLRRLEGKQMFICRVVAAGGDVVEITDGGRLIVNGNAMVESNIFSPTTEYVGFVEYPLTLAPDECFVMADLRNGGADSRFFGPVKQDELLGVVITIVRRNNL